MIVLEYVNKRSAHIYLTCESLCVLVYWFTSGLYLQNKAIILWLAPVAGGGLFKFFLLHLIILACFLGQMRKSTLKDNVLHSYLKEDIKSKVGQDDKKLPFCPKKPPNLRECLRFQYLVKVHQVLLKYLHFIQKLLYFS